MEEVEECQAVIDEVLNGYKTGDVMRGRVDEVFQAKLKAIEAISTFWILMGQRSTQRFIFKVAIVEKK